MVMRKIHVVMISTFLSGVSLHGFAQESDKKEDLNREMTLERVYDPIVQDATKVNTLPVVREMSVTKRPIVYSNYSIAVIPEKEMSVLPSVELMTEVDHLARKGYLHFGGGMLFNLMGDFGYHLIDNDKSRLGVNFSRRSMNGNVKFDDKWGIDKRKAKFNDNIGGLDFKHHFDMATLRLGGKFGHSAFNYYGMPTNLLPTNYASVLYDSTTIQANRLINFYGGIASDLPYSLGYHFGVDYTNFKQKYSLHKDLDGMTENHIALDMGMSSPLSDGKNFGVDLNMNLLSYSEPVRSNSVVLDSAAFKTHVNATLNPYFSMKNDTWKLLLGFNFMLVSQNSETDVYVSPNISFDAAIANWTVFYATLGGGIESNSMAEISRMNRYINPAFTADASKTWADLKLGIRSSSTAGLWFDVFAGYKYTESDLLFNPSSFPWVNNGFNNVSMAFQPTTQRIQAGATLKYDFQKVVDFYVKGVYNYYNVKNSDTWKNTYVTNGMADDELKAYGRPSFVANAGINIRPVKPLTLALDYCMMTGMQAYTGEESVKMKAINDLRFRASWQFNDMIGAYAQFNNLMFQKHEMYYGYPMQPFSVMVGAAVNF